jgi:photosystem II stability/assembly factor-like uncharacterized protein
MKKTAIGCVIVLSATWVSMVSAQENQFRADRFPGLQWRDIGPQRGGRSLACTGSPGRVNEYYFGATGGGLWKTTDGGNDWFPVTDGKISSSSIGAVAVAETNPDIIYIGGGEVQLRGSITQGDGVYKSTDGGKSWRHIGLRETQAVARIRVHPTNPDIVYVAALGHPYGDNEERGVFRSTDGGKTWQKVLYKSPKAGGADLIIDRTNPRVIYASLWQVYRKAWKMWGGGPDSGLYKSENGGDTWVELTKNPGMPEGPIGKIGVTVSPADPKRVWAIVEAAEGGVFRSDDGGATWKRTNDERKLRQRAFYYSRIYADPQDRETVYALNVNFYKSTDGGVTFATEIKPPHGDNHDLWIDPNNRERMCGSDDGGGHVSLNGGATWTEQDYGTTQLYHVNTTNDVPYHVCGAQQDNTTVCVPSDDWHNMLVPFGANHGWRYEVGGGESGYITQHPTNLDVFYSGSQGALLTRYDRSNGQIRDIQIYPRFFSGEPASALPERWQWTYPIVFSPLDANVLYTSSQHVWKTTNDGQSWERISPDLTYADPETLGETGGVVTMDMNGPEIYGTVFALAPSFHDIGTIWAGSDDGKIHVTRDGGKNWQDVTPSDLPKFSRVEIIDESRHTPGTAYFAASRYQVDDREPYVFRTRDYGKTWTKIASGIAPGHFARAVREDHVRKDLLFLGTEHGAYVSFDAGDRWQSLQLNLPDTPIRDLVVKDADVVLGTHGRGFHILDDIEPLRDLSPAVYTKALTVFEPDEPAIRGIGNAVIQYFLAEKAEKLTVEILDGAGNVINTFEGADEVKKATVDFWSTPASTTPTKAAGLNRFEWNLRYKGATTFEGMITWSAEPEHGPKAPPGRYQARVTAGGVSETVGFEVVMEPRLKGVTQADFEEQFRLASQINEKTSAANDAVVEIRSVRKELETRLEGTSSSQLQQQGRDLVEKISEIERDLYQVKNQSGQDPLNFPIRLNNRLAALQRSVETGDAKPTDGAYKVLQELTAELEGHLSKIDGLLGQTLDGVNQELTSEGMEPVTRKPN